MAYLRSNRVKGQLYYQITEAYREGGQKHERALCYLGRDLGSRRALLRFWEFLGQPARIPYKPGCRQGIGTPSLETACETIIDLELFLKRATHGERELAAEGLKFLLESAAS